MAGEASGTFETDGAIGTKGQSVPAPVPAAQVDTTEVGRVAAAGWAPAPTTVSGTKDTLTSTVVDKYPAYSGPAGPTPGANVDTTKTDSPVGNGTLPAADPSLWVSGTVETHNIGAVPAGSAAVPVAPAAPGVVSGDRYVVVSWAAVADPSPNAKVLQYVVESDTGGHEYAGRDKTSVRFRNVTGGRAQKFRVRAGNRNGTGPYGPWSAASVAPGNTDEIRAVAITADNAVNPIYNQNGTVKPGSYGAPTAPGKPTVSAQGTAGTATVTWTAPSTGQPSGGYDVIASSGQKVHVGPAVLTANVAGLTVAASVTFTVVAVGQLQTATSAPSNAYTVA